MDLSSKELADIMKLLKFEQRQILKLHHQTLLARQQRLATVINALEDYVSRADIFNLNISNNSPILPLEEQYKNEAKIVYGETKKYKEYEKSLEKLSAEEKEKLSYEFTYNIEKVLKK